MDELRWYDGGVPDPLLVDVSGDSGLPRRGTPVESCVRNSGPGMSLGRGKPASMASDELYGPTGRIRHC